METWISEISGDPLRKLTAPSCIPQNKVNGQNFNAVQTLGFSEPILLLSFVARLANHTNPRTMYNDSSDDEQSYLYNSQRDEPTTEPVAPRAADEKEMSITVQERRSTGEPDRLSN